MKLREKIGSRTCRFIHRCLSVQSLIYHIKEFKICFRFSFTPKRTTDWGRPALQWNVTVSPHTTPTLSSLLMMLILFLYCAPFFQASDWPACDQTPYRHLLPWHMHYIVRMLRKQLEKIFKTRPASKLNLKRANSQRKNVNFRHISGYRTSSLLKTSRSSLLLRFFFKLQWPFPPAGGCRDKQFWVNAQASSKQRSGLPLKKGILWLLLYIMHAYLS